MYARSDVQSVCLPRFEPTPVEAAMGAVPVGGCGVQHRRPVDVSGRPVSIWGLDCAPCEVALRSDPCFSSTIDSIPETPDEVADRKARKETGKAEVTDAIARMMAEWSGRYPRPVAVAEGEVA